MEIFDFLNCYFLNLELLIESINLLLIIKAIFKHLKAKDQNHN